jgi:hypothetical protein
MMLGVSGHSKHLGNAVPLDVHCAGAKLIARDRPYFSACVFGPPPPGQSLRDASDDSSGTLKHR